MENNKYSAMNVMEGAEIIGFIQQIHDYNKILIHPLNRDIRRPHVEELKVSMKKQNMLIPILINKEGYIIDGNHRATAWSELELPILFYMVEDYDVKEMQQINTLQSNWELEDYLKHYVSKGKENYVKFQQLIDDYKISNISDLLCVISNLSEVSIGEKELGIIFKKGDLTVRFYDKVEEFLKELSLFDKYNYSRHTSFVRAFLKLYIKDFYDKEYVRTRLDVCENILTKGRRSTIEDFCEFLASEFYNNISRGIVIVYNKDFKDYYELNVGKKGRKKIK